MSFPARRCKITSNPARLKSLKSVQEKNSRLADYGPISLRAIPFSKLNLAHSQTFSFPLQLIFHGEQEINMLYIFDLGNVIVDIDFNRVLGAWSDLAAFRWRR
jgi:hypothetical protein